MKMKNFWAVGNQQFVREVNGEIYTWSGPALVHSTSYSDQLKKLKVEIVKTAPKGFTLRGENYLKGKWKNSETKNGKSI